MRIIPRRLVAYSKDDLKAAWSYLFSKDKKTPVRQFEADFAKYIGVPHAMAVSSAREGFLCLIDALEFEEGDEVILAAYNYHVMPIILKEKGLVPVFVDIDPETLNVDAGLIEKHITSKTKCILVTHLFGKAADAKKIEAIARERNIIIIEDAAHSCGAMCEGERLGSFGDFGMFSFGTGKCIVTLGGGMIVSKNTPLFEKFKARFERIQVQESGFIKSFCSYLNSLIQILCTNRIVFILLIYPGLLICNLFKFDPIEKITGDQYTFADVHSKSKISAYTGLQATLGLSQLKRLDTINNKRIQFAKLLNREIGDLENIKIQKISDEKDNVVLSFTAVVDQKRDLREYLLKKGIDTKESSMRNCAKLLSMNGRFPQLDTVDDKIIELPCSQHLSEKDVLYQSQVLKEYYTKS